MSYIFKPEVFSVPLQQYSKGGMRHHGMLYEFAPSHLRPLYVIRDLILRDGNDTFDEISVEKKRNRFIGLFKNLAATGVVLPQYYVVGGRKNEHTDLHVVTEKIRAVPLDGVKGDRVRFQSEALITSLADYLKHAKATGDPILYDTFKLKQFAYGPSRTDNTPQFHMVDLDGYISRVSGSNYYAIRAEEICSVAEQIGSRIGYPALLEHAVSQLPDTDYMLEEPA